jgi:arginine decarboxylase
LAIWKSNDSVKLYGIENWGNGYFGVNRKGHLIVRPSAGDSRTVDIREVVDKLAARRIKAPLLLRFPQLLQDRVRVLNESFKRSIAEVDYKGRYFGVFPVKVNQRRPVVEELLRAGRSYEFGLEVGSKSELFAGMALHDSPKALFICNGFKDDDYIRAALIGTLIGKQVIIVAEKLFELEAVLSVARQLKVTPMIGLRARLYSKGSGVWENSGGERSKFGLSTTEILAGVQLLARKNKLASLTMLHFHLGSQVTEVKRVQEAIKEAARVYAEIKKMNVDIKYLNIGGGLGVDYDGSRTSSDYSVNYTLEEYTNNVVYTIKETCKETNVPEPHIVSESGRALAAYHAVLVAEVHGQLNGKLAQTPPPPGRKPVVHAVVKDMEQIVKNMDLKTFREYYHDALQLREELFTLFDLGYADLWNRARGEELFKTICAKASAFSMKSKRVPEEFETLHEALSHTYVCNFSVFQSVPDSWALDHLFPIVPIQRLNERPDVHATLADITCDSDGKIDRFVDLKDIKRVLRLHQVDSDPYYVAMLLVGAYQDVIGDYHNLLGAIHEAQILLDDKGEWHLAQLTEGDSIEETLNYVGYDPGALMERFRQQVQQAVSKKKVKARQAQLLIKHLEDGLQGYTYLEK